MSSLLPITPPPNLEMLLDACQDTVHVAPTVLVDVFPQNPNQNPVHVQQVEPLASTTISSPVGLDRYTFSRVPGNHEDLPAAGMTTVTLAGVADTLGLLDRSSDNFRSDLLTLCAGVVCAGEFGRSVVGDMVGETGLETERGRDVVEERPNLEG
jgi:hypothetical protein